MLDKLALLMSLAASHIEDLETGLEDGTYQDDNGEIQNTLDEYNDIDFDTLYNQVKQKQSTLDKVYELAERYTSTDLNSLDMGEELRTITEFK